MYGCVILVNGLRDRAGDFLRRPSIHHQYISMLHQHSARTSVAFHIFEMLSQTILPRLIPRPHAIVGLSKAQVDFVDFVGLVTHKSMGI